jgi:hypothetical protein
LQVVKEEEEDEEEDEVVVVRRSRRKPTSRGRSNQSSRGLHSCELYNDRKFVETTMSDNYSSDQDDTTKQLK